MKGLPAGYGIRFGELLDLPILIAVDRAASELFRPTGLIPDMAAIPESVPAEVLANAVEDGMLIVAHDEESPVGFALCRQRERYLYLEQLSVDPDHGRQGLGKLLVNMVVNLAAEHRCNVVALSTFRDVPWNGPFYRSLGFREIPRNKLESWMLEIEQEQSATLDVSQRCFMRRSVRSLRQRG